VDFKFQQCATADQFVRSCTLLEFGYQIGINASMGAAAVQCSTSSLALAFVSRRYDFVIHEPEP